MPIHAHGHNHYMLAQPGLTCMDGIHRFCTPELEMCGTARALLLYFLEDAQLLVGNSMHDALPHAYTPLLMRPHFPHFTLTPPALLISSASTATSLQTHDTHALNHDQPPHNALGTTNDSQNQSLIAPGISAAIPGQKNRFTYSRYC